MHSVKHTASHSVGRKGIGDAWMAQSPSILLKRSRALACRWSKRRSVRLPVGARFLSWLGRPVVRVVSGATNRPRVPTGDAAHLVPLTYLRGPKQALQPTA